MESDTTGGAVRIGLLVAVVLAALVGGSAVFYQSLTADDPAEEMNRVQVEYLIHEKVNERRAAHGLPALDFDTDLRVVARGYSEQMATEEFFGHYSPEGESFEERYAAHGYECAVVTNETHVFKGGENLARSYYDQPVNTTAGVETEYDTLDALAEGVVRGWMNSPDHRENLLTPEWQREAIGVYVTAENAVYVTQNFC